MAGWMRAGLKYVQPGRRTRLTCDRWVREYLDSIAERAAPARRSAEARARGTEIGEQLLQRARGREHA